MRRIENPKRFKVPRCSCVSSNSTSSKQPCHCLSPAQHRRLEEIFGRRAERLRKTLAYKKCIEETMSRTRRHSLEDDEKVVLDQDQENGTPIKKQLPRSGRSKWYNFGRGTGGWGTGGWGRISGQNNANTGGLWGLALPTLGTLLFGNWAGTNTPPRSDSMPDLSLSGLNARLLNLRRTPSATDLTRTNPTSAIWTQSTGTLVDVSPNSPSVLPSATGGLLSRTASQEVASLTGTVPVAPASALTRTRNDLYMPMSAFRPINLAGGASRSSATGALPLVRASSGGAATTSTSMELTPMSNRPLPAMPNQNVRLSLTSSSSGAETAIPVGEPIYPNYKDFSSVPPEHMKWHDVVGAKWRHWGARHPYLQGGLGLGGTSAMSGGVSLECKPSRTK